MSGRRNYFRCMLISPSDVKAERDAITEVIDNWNAHFGRALGARLEIVRWESHATPDTSAAAQEVLNQQLLEDCDFGIAIFWSRLGTPTSLYSSGSVEEIKTLVNRGKRVLIYFSTSSIPQDSLHDDQFQKLKEFRAEIESKALVATYSEISVLREQIQLHVTDIVASFLQENTMESVGKTDIHGTKKIFDPFIYRLRRKVFGSLRDALSKITTHGDADNEIIGVLHKQRMESEFLFGKEICDYIREWITSAASLYLANKMLSSQSITDQERHKFAELAAKNLLYFSDQYEGMLEKCYPYLGVIEK